MARPRRRQERLVTGLLAAGLVAGAVGLLLLYEGQKTDRVTEEKLYYPSGRFLREAVLGFREMAADYLWFQTIQYYGGYRKGEHDLRYFSGLVDCVVQLDPRFIEAYYFGSLVYSMDEGRITAAADLIKRGILANPNRWILPFQVGFLYYVFVRDFERAAVWFDAAARSPDATDFARRFAAFARKRAGNLEGSLVLWQNLYDTTSDPGMKALAERMIRDCQEKLVRPQGGTKRGER